MDGQSGVLRIGASGRAIGFFYTDRKRTLQPVIRFRDRSRLLGFSVWRDTPRFQEPVFGATSGSASRVTGTWSSGVVRLDGYGVAGAGHGSWVATRETATWAEPSDLEPIPLPTWDAPGIACTVSDERGHHRPLKQKLKSTATSYDKSTHSLIVRGDEIDLAFDGSSPSPQAIDLTRGDFDESQGVISFTHGDIALADSAYDALDYRAATGKSPGWWTMAVESRGMSMRLRAAEVFRVSRRIEPTKIGGMYRFRTLDVVSVACSVVADVPTQPQHLSPEEQLRRAAETLK